MKIKLNRNICITIIFILLILFSAGINLAFSQTIFMPVSEISPGMKGIGKTVFHGTQIEAFQVDIIDIVKGWRYLSRDEWKPDLYRRQTYWSYILCLGNERTQPLSNHSYSRNVRNT